MKLRYLLLFLLSWVILLLFIENTAVLITQYWYFFIIGLTGAIVANSTGAGGGIIFIPFFATLGITATESLATSIVIQSFGMSAGAIGWLSSIKDSEHFSHNSLDLLKTILIFTAPTAIAGVLIAQYVIANPPFQMVDIFRAFSAFFGATLLFITLLKKSQTHTKYHLNAVDKYMLIVASFIGGLVTSWISIGIGEIIAILLIMRHIPIMLAVSVGVCLSALSVLAATPFHITQSNPVWEIILFAAPAAVIGGTFARFLSFRLGPVRLKIFFASWILATAISM